MNNYNSIRSEIYYAIFKDMYKLITNKISLHYTEPGSIMESIPILMITVEGDIQYDKKY